MWLKRGEISSKTVFTEAVQDVLLLQRRFIVVLAECCDVEEVGRQD